METMKLNGDRDKLRLHSRYGTEYKLENGHHLPVNCSMILGREPVALDNALNPVQFQITHSWTAL